MMSEVICDRCGHRAHGCPRCGRTTILGGRIGRRSYCHTESEQPSCYTLQLRRGQPPKILDQVYAEETEEYFPSLRLIETDVGVRFWFDSMGEHELRFSRSAVEDIHKALGKYLRETEPRRGG